MNPVGGGGRGGMDIDRLLGQAKQAAQRAEQVRQQREELRAVGESEDGLVRATVDAAGRVVALSIDPRAMRQDSEGLAQKVLVAIRQGYQEIEAKADELAGEALGDPELFRKIKSGQFDMYEYLQQQGVNLSGLRGRI
jgi:DNA-binding protein YbaB